MSPAAERCPWCGSQIAHEKFIQIQNAIREEERRKLAEAVRPLKAQLEKDAAARFAAKERKLEAERTKIAALAATAKKQVEQARQQAEKQRAKDIAEVREILQKELNKALLKKDADFARERDALQKKIADMSRRIGKKSSDVGEGGELDLYEELRGAFPSDRIVQSKGPGPDILQDVRYKGASAGTILIDARPRAGWQNTFVTKLRQEQTEIAADHAILSTVVFPAGKKELFIDRGVIVAAPARVIAIVDVLRKAMIAVHVAKLGEAERANTMSRLFRHITSPAFKRKLAEAEALAIEALEIDVEEKRVHENVWKKRGMVISRIKNVLREIDAEVGEIVEAKDEGRRAAASVVRMPTRVQ